MNNSDNVLLIDSTLRDGEQTPGVVFSRQDKIAIANNLVAIGLQELEVGTPAMGLEEQEDIRAIAKLRLPARLTCWCRAKASDLEQAFSCSVSSVHISFPTSPIHLKVLGKDQKWVLEHAKEIMEFARSKFSFISVGAQDASRADRRFLLEFAQWVQINGADRLRIADTVGVLNPAQTWELVTELRKAAPKLNLEFHGHNDLGMATANTLTAIQAGAQSVSVTVGGLGERTGNAPLEEVALGIITSLKMRCGIHTQGLDMICRQVSGLARRSIPDNKPIVGKMAFLHESGIHCHGQLNDANAYQPFSPELVGQSPADFVLGKHSGTASLRHVLEKYDLTLSEITLHNLLSKLRQTSQTKKRALTINELKELYHGL